MSGPGSTTMPVMVVLGTGAVETVVKVSVRSVPGVPVSAASSSAPSACALIALPSTCSVMVEAPGSGLVKNSHAPVSSDAMTIVAGIKAPVESVAKKVLLVSGLGSIAREKVIFGRCVTPTSPAPIIGVNAAIVSGGSAGSVRSSVSVVVLPAASVVV